MDRPIVRAATEAERKAVIDVITLAFATDPLVRWAIPHPAHYLAAMPPIVDAFGGGGLAHGSTDVVDGYEGAALWLPPGVEPNAERMLAITTEYVQGKLRDQFFGVFEQMGELPPARSPLVSAIDRSRSRQTGARLFRMPLTPARVKAALSAT